MELDYWKMTNTETMEFQTVLEPSSWVEWDAPMFNDCDCSHDCSPAPAPSPAPNNSLF